MEKKYLILEPFKGSHNGAVVTQYDKDDVVPSDDKPFSDELAKVALKEGWIKVAPKPRKKKEDPKDPEHTPETLAHFEIFSLLDPNNKDHFIEEGRPEVAAVKHLLPSTIETSRAIIDEHWAAYVELQKSEGWKEKLAKFFGANK